MAKTTGFTAISQNVEVSSSGKGERLRSHLVTEIASGRLGPGAAIPTEKQLGEVFQVARGTVRKAIASLVQDGFLIQKPGKGAIVHDQASQRLSGQSSVLALIRTNTLGTFLSSLNESFENAAAAQHFQVVSCNTNGDVSRQGDFILQLIDQRVGGVALNPIGNVQTPLYQVRQLREHRIPLVFLGRRVEGIDAPLLAIPSQEIGQLAAKQILAAGHRHICYCNLYRGEASLRHEAGLRRVLQSEGHDESALSVCYAVEEPCDPSQRLEHALEGYFRENGSPTVIFTGSDASAESIYLWLVRRGLRVPDDVSLVSFGGRMRERAFQRMLTSVTVDEVQMGRVAIEILSAMRSGDLPLNHNETRTMPIDMYAGETLRHLNRKPAP
ncbi:MAG TPA: GntR family transcriptional regulator [Planctomicrobium sp.]|nr:GntR family transcriptional regulator [Planctomicrobium sp.]